MTRVLFWWLEPDAGGSRSKRWEWMPQCPVEGQTVHVPYPTDEDPRDSNAMTVRSVSWACSNPPFWHAEVYLV